MAIDYFPICEDNVINRCITTFQQRKSFLRKRSSLVLTYCIKHLTLRVRTFIVCKKRVGGSHLYQWYYSWKWWQMVTSLTRSLFEIPKTQFSLKWAKLKYDITNQLVLTWDIFKKFWRSQDVSNLRNQKLVF